MNEAAAILQRPQSVYEIEATLLSLRKWLNDLRSLAADFAMLDVRPMIWDGETLTPTRELQIPDNLLTMITEAHAEVHRLELALQNASRARMR